MVAIAVATITAPLTGAADVCPGDCDLTRGVSIAELQTSVRISLGLGKLEDCPIIDSDGDGAAGISEVVRSISAALDGCVSLVGEDYECPWPDLDDDDIHAFLMAGQSNMRGVGKVDELPEYLRTGDPRVKRLRGYWQTLRPVFDFFGPEFGFADTIAQACPNSTIGIIKIFHSNTGINSWLRDWDEELATLTGRPDVGPLYPPMMEQARLGERLADVSWEGFVWVHGQNDKNLAELAERYGENLALLIDAVRDDLGDPHLPLILHHRLSVLPPDTNGAATNAYWLREGHHLVELAKVEAPLHITDTYVANWFDLPVSGLVHLSSAGYITGGRLLADALLRGRADDSSNRAQE